jgi:hypothetical protein
MLGLADIPHGHNLRQVGPRCQLLHVVGSGSDGTRNAPFDHPPRGVAWPRLGGQHHIFQLQTTSLGQQLQSVSGCGRCDRWSTSHTSPPGHLKGTGSLQQAWCSD